MTTTMRTNPAANPGTSTRTRRTRRTAGAVAAAAACLTLATALPATATPPRDHDAHLRQVLQQDADALLAQGTPGVLAELDRAGRRDVTVRAGYGDVAAQTPVPEDARFRIASVTKPFVAATLLQLVGEGRLSLEDTVEQHLPGLVQGGGNDGNLVTVRQLLQHTSGLPEYLLAMPQLFSEEGFQQHRFDEVSQRQAVALAMTQAPTFAPGTSWNYSNTNYVLAGMVIEQVTGNTWQHEVRERIVRPLGLRHTTLPGSSSEIPGPHAVGYERFPGEGATPEDPRYGEAVDATELNPSWAGAAGEIISTTDDVNEFLQALAGGRVLRPAQWVEMTATVAASEDFRTNWPGARYGLGIMWVPNSCGGMWSHGGDIQGFMTRNGVTPDGRRSVVVSFNTDSPVPQPGAQVPAGDLATQLIDDALCR
ncbi:serine hydrolase domain-containing protein [Kineococcus vitellinus]|uniref:serine hydrolase domain-containing protein n=1 Tax=Kineococcus vitellinus TaxID=2696565 RepID=UPI00196AD08E|nr:serine hydrolase domain-containing protein [Kineococcus vitellinus]